MSKAVSKKSPEKKAGKPVGQVAVCDICAMALPSDRELRDKHAKYHEDRGDSAPEEVSEAEEGEENEEEEGEDGEPAES